MQSSWRIVEPEVLSLRRCRPLLGTFVEIATPARHEAAVAAAYRAVAHVHARMSFHTEDSDLAALRRAPAGEVVAVDAETVAVLRTAATLHVQSGGVFDVSVGAKLVASGFLPEPVGCDVAHADGDAGDIEIVDDTHVRCRRTLLLDLGGIAKGYAVDRAIETLAQAGVSRAIVNAGGDIRVLGDTPERIWLRSADGRLSNSILLANSAVATSANLADRRPTRNGVATPHIGRDGEPVLARHAASVVAPHCVHADAMTKVALADSILATAMLDELGGAIVMPAGRRAA